MVYAIISSVETAECRAILRHKIAVDGQPVHENIWGKTQTAGEERPHTFYERSAWQVSIERDGQILIMNELPDAEMKVRSFAGFWDPLAPESYVVRWTDVGWKFLENHDFPLSSRSQLDDASSLMFLDFEDRARLIPAREIREPLSTMKDHVSSISERIDMLLNKFNNVDIDLCSAKEAMNILAQAVVSLDRQIETLGYRINRDPIFSYAGRVEYIAAEHGICISRGRKWEPFSVHYFYYMQLL